MPFVPGLRPNRKEFKPCSRTLETLGFCPWQWSFRSGNIYQFLPKRKIKCSFSPMTLAFRYQSGLAFMGDWLLTPLRYEDMHSLSIKEHSSPTVYCVLQLKYLEMIMLNTRWMLYSFCIAERMARKTSGTWRDGSASKNTGCSLRRSRFHSEYPHGS